MYHSSQEGSAVQICTYELTQESTSLQLCIYGGRWGERVSLCPNTAANRTLCRGQLSLPGTGKFFISYYLCVSNPLKNFLSEPCGAPSCTPTASIILLALPRCSPPKPNINIKYQYQEGWPRFSVNLLLGKTQLFPVIIEKIEEEVTILGRESVPSKAHGDKRRIDSAGDRCFIGIHTLFYLPTMEKGRALLQRPLFLLLPSSLQGKAVSEPPSPEVSHELT